MSSRVARSNIMSSRHLESEPWTVIVPVKEIHLAKSRLGTLGVEARRRFARAFALDTVAAALACPHVERVVVVTNDAVGELFAELGCVVVPDVPDSGLNPALTYAGERVHAQHPAAALAALSSDLPSLRPVDLSTAFESAPDVPWFVADAHGIGTTMLGSPAGLAWSPTFGPDSRVAHLALDVAEISSPGLERLRLDVDTAADLDVARRLGVGENTAKVLVEFDSLG
jgi:2-phospho-L-lactate guanylyltransferase